MFTETIVHAGGDSRGPVSESHALMLLRRALNRGFGSEATLNGGASIRWTRIDLTTHQPVLRSITLTPEMPVGTLDASTRAHLALIGLGDARHVLTADSRHIVAGDTVIPTGETARLRARRLVAVDDRGRVRLTLAARLGLLARDHTQAGGPDSFAMCSCGLTTSAPSGEIAGNVQRGHRQRVLARFVESIDAAYAAAISSR
ncbi:hypothetical protein ABZ923_41070 [Streptomyces sp. NPDC046881]|uniref:hypothetical protein n=1 Tax=Streptomyces sp. NPDC046881 TaxID=3155374 RepID=UPI0033E413E8